MDYPMTGAVMLAVSRYGAASTNGEANAHRDVIRAAVEGMEDDLAAARRSADDARVVQVRDAANRCVELWQEGYLTHSHDAKVAIQALAVALSGSASNVGGPACNPQCEPSGCGACPLDDAPVGACPTPFTDSMMSRTDIGSPAWIGCAEIGMRQFERLAGVPPKMACPECAKKQAFIDRAFDAHPNLDLDVEHASKAGDPNGNLAVTHPCRNCFFHCREPHACIGMNGAPHPGYKPDSAPKVGGP